LSQKIAMIFPGQGSQSVGMGKAFYDASDEAKRMIESASDRVGIDFKALMFDEGDKLDQTVYTQPAILLVSMIAYRLFQEHRSSEPKLLLGHSLGEVSAVCAAGAIDYLDAVELVHKRGHLMQAACEGVEAGMMVIVGLEDEKVEAICVAARNQHNKQVWPANYNQDGQLVVAGLKPDLQSLEATFKEAGAKRALLLNMSVASHCPLLTTAQDPLRLELQKVLHDPFVAPVVSNVTAKPYHTKQQAVELLSEQLIYPVRYKQSIEAIAPDIDLAIEFGNGKVLSGLNRRIAKEMKTYNVSDMDSLQATLDALA